MNDNQDPRTRFGVDMLINALHLHPGRSAGGPWSVDNDQFCRERVALEARLMQADVPIDVRDYGLARIAQDLAIPAVRPEDEDLGGPEAGGN